MSRHHLHVVDRGGEAPHRGERARAHQGHRPAAHLSELGVARRRARHGVQRLGRSAESARARSQPGVHAHARRARWTSRPACSSLTGAGGKRIQSTDRQAARAVRGALQPDPDGRGPAGELREVSEAVPVHQGRAGGLGDTRVLNGEVGDYVTIARKDRNSDDWYLGADHRRAAAHAARVARFPRRGQKLLRHYLPRRQERAASTGDGHVARNRDAAGVALRHAAAASSRRAAARRFASRRVTARSAAIRPRRSPSRSSTSNEHAARPNRRCRSGRSGTCVSDFSGIQFGFALQNANVEPHLPDAGREDRRHPDPVDRGAAHRADRAADRRLLLGSHLEPAGPAAAVLPGGRHPGVAGAHRDAALAGVVDGGRACCGFSMPASTSRWSRSARSSAISCPSGSGPPAIAMQSFFIGVGAVVASMLPWMLAHAGVSNVGTGSGRSAIPDTVRYSFEIGAAGAGGRDAVDDLHDARVSARRAARLRRTPRRTPRASTPRQRGTARSARGSSWLAVGHRWARTWSGASRSTSSSTCCAAGIAVWGAGAAGQSAASARQRHVRDADARHRQHAARACAQLVPVQFFSWLALFAMWIYTTPAVTQVHFGATDTVGAALQRGRQLGGRAVRAPTTASRRSRPS